MSKKKSLPFDKRGGSIVINRRMMAHPAYKKLSAQAKVLMLFMQEQWRNDKPVSYGVREAAEKISCDVKTARKAFVMLREQGFITCVDESLFNSRTGSKARDWRLTWMPYMDKSPTNDWEKLSNEKLNQRRDISPNKLT